ncbi:CDP-diacylglycerol-inositol 3-phosphatidyltransferase [Fragilaria crotonensis]|nr:CDP-diacylglycerol-inositol 3-phosphatidyltransferase [Fragilaria crotonensis]
MNRDVAQAGNHRTATSKSIDAPMPYQVPVALYVPNILCYLRIITAFSGLWFKDHQPFVALFIWLTSAALDLLDGIIARTLNQTSNLGILLDVCADNVLRTCLWMAAMVQYPNQPLLLSISCLVVSTEWFTFMSTQLHSAQRKQEENFQTINTNSHWKIERHHDPWWVRAVFQSGFRNPCGTWTIYGLFATPLFLWMSAGNAVVISQYIPFFRFWTFAAYSGRFYAFVVECYFSVSYLAHVVEGDTVQRNEQQHQQRFKETNHSK